MRLLCDRALDALFVQRRRCCCLQKLSRHCGNPRRALDKTIRFTFRRNYCVNIAPDRFSLRALSFPGSLPPPAATSFRSVSSTFPVLAYETSKTRAIVITSRPGPKDVQRPSERRVTGLRNSKRKKKTTIKKLW